jgi:hypothetical protein
MTSPVFTFSIAVVLVHRAPSGQVDEYGNDIMSVTRATVPNVVFVPAGSSENVSFADQSTQSETFYMPYGTDVSVLDAIEFNGDTYEVNGSPDIWSSPFSGRVSPIRISATKITGVTT